MERPGAGAAVGAAPRGLGEKPGFQRSRSTARSEAGAGGGAASGMRERDGREGRQRAQGWQRTGLAGSQAPAAASRPVRRPHGAGAPDPPGTPSCAALGSPSLPAPLLQPEGCSRLRLGASPPASPTALCPPRQLHPIFSGGGGSPRMLSPPGWGFLAPSSRHQFRPFQPPHARTDVSQDPPERGWAAARTRIGGLPAGRGVWQGGLADPPLTPRSRRGAGGGFSSA